MDQLTAPAPRAELLPYKGDFYLWKYVPSMIAGTIFTIIFLVLSVAHTWKMVHCRLWFCLAFTIGGYFEIVGFIGRVVAHKTTDELVPYLLQSVFLLIPPSLFAASIYMTLGLIMRGLGPKGEMCSIIRVKWLTTLFVLGDVFSFLIQCSGAGLTATGDDPKLGEYVIILGLIIQILFFGLFVVSAVIFHLRYRRNAPGWRTMVATDMSASFNWETLMMMLYTTSALILVRCIFRVLEYVMGSDGYLLENEWPLYAFDAALMATTMVIFYIWYPSEIPRFQNMTEVDMMGLTNPLGGTK